MELSLDPKFLEGLRKTRLEKKISLQDIAGATRINVRFLEAIEQGELDILPKPYIKAFIKQYAQYIGYDEKTVSAQLEDYDARQRPEQQQEVTTAQSGASGAKINTPKLKTMFLSLAIIGGIALFVYLLLSVFSTSDEPVAERPFQDVIREMEEHAQQTTIEPIDSPAIAETEPRDSVSLAVTTIDTVWVTITVDNLVQEEFIFPPGRQQEWKAANDFMMTVGNAGGISITVNDDSIGVLGDSGQVVRNLHITRDGIQR